MKDFLKTIIGAIIAVPVIVYGGLLLLGFLHSELNFSFGEAVLTIFLAPFALAILYFVLSLLWELISDAVLKSTDLKSFLMNLSVNVIGSIIGIAIIIGGLYFVAQIAVCIGVLILGLGFAAGLLGIGNSKEREIERLEDEIKDLESERDSIPTYNGILMGGSGISESKLKSNRIRRDDLNEKIQDKQRELDDLQR